MLGLVGVFCFEDNIFHTSGGVMKKFVGFYYCCNFNVCLWAFLSLIGFMFLSSPAFALQSGDFTYTESGGTITITGYTGPSGVAVIPAVIDGEPVVGIKVQAFYDCNYLTSVTIPASVTSIGWGAFDGCSGLTSIVVDASNTAYSSQEGVLYDKAMTVLIQYPEGKSGGFTIPDSVTSIGEEAFGSCSGLTRVTIPNSVTSIEEGAFGACRSLTSVTIPNSVTSIEEYTFTGCSGLTSVTIGNSVTSIGEAAFLQCGLTSVTIPDSVTSIGGFAFQDCHGLTIVTIPDSVTSIGEAAFAGCSGLTRVTIPNSVTSIEGTAFYGCTGLTRAYFYGNAPSMGSQVFDGCASNFTVCYTAGSTGFTNPWYGYPTAVCEETPSSTTTVSSTTTTTTLPETSTTTIPSTTTTTVPANQCAAEAIYGRDSEETELLREYRDKVLSKSATGRQMIKTYYKLSPAVAEVLQKNDTARESARRVLDSLMPAIREKLKQ